MKKKVYVVIHDFYSHDMFVSMWAKMGNPKVFGIYNTLKEAEKHIREGMDDYIEERWVQ